MATWSRKQRTEMRALQHASLKRQVLCRKCDKVHDHPVCEPAHKAFVKAGAEIMRKRRLRDYKRKGKARDNQRWHIEQNARFRRRPAKA